MDFRDADEVDAPLAFDLGDMILDRGSAPFWDRVEAAPRRSPAFVRALKWSLRAGLLVAAVAALGVALVMPLGWREQAIAGGLLIGAAIALSTLTESARVTLALIVVSMFSSLRYGYWRATQTWEGLTSAGHLFQWDTIFVLLLLAAEFYAIATLALGYFQTLCPLRRPTLPLPGDPATWPTVDVLIPTYNEPLSVVRATVLGVLAMDYPAAKMRVYVLDDGRRPEFRDFAAQLGIGYITRNNNAHAKAGNINHALQQVTCEFVAIFDCDHVPTRSFLQATLGWFLRDRRLGLVQTPHHFYSPDPFERNLGQFRKVPNEGELFHRLVQDGNDLWNASFFCGSCAVMRRQALDDVGGIAVETVTEDAHTALRMHRRGWSSAYINVPQAAGLATESLAAHLGQRIRWARGMVQILRLENPLFARGLSLPQRLCYLNASTHFLFAVPRLIFLTVPLTYLLLGMVNIYGYSLAVFAYALPHIVISHVTNSRIQRHHRGSFWNEVYEAVLAPYILVPTLLALVNPRLGKFNVTSKGGVIARSYFDRRVAWPFIGLLGLNVAGLVMAGQRYVADPAHHDTVVMNAVWTLYNIVILSVAASVARETRQRRTEVRVEARLPVTVLAAGRLFTGVTAHLSRSGATVLLDAPVRLPAGAGVALLLDSGRSRCRVAGRLVDGRWRELHVQFAGLNLRQEQFLVNSMYGRAETWQVWSLMRPPDAVLRSLARILWLSLRGLVVVVAGLLTPQWRSRAKRARRRERAAAATASVVLFGWIVGSSSAVEAQDASRQPAAAAAAPTPTSFRDEYLFGSRAERSGGLTGAGASMNVSFDVPVTKIVGEATLALRYAAPRLAAGEARLELSLNGTRIGAVALAPGTDLELDVPLPTDLLVTDNTLSMRLEGRCRACTPRLTPWVTIDPRSRLAIGGTRLPLGNDLALLPIPFFDSSAQHAWRLPVVFAEPPDPEAVTAAAVVASWFGVASDVRGVRFPVSVGQLPEGNAVVVTRQGSELANGVSLPGGNGPLLAVRDNPRDPFGKLLVVAGSRPGDLVAAARALAAGPARRAHVDSARVADPNVAVRPRYDAPRWLALDRPAPIGMYTSAERLKLSGSGTVTLYFRLAPDLVLSERQSVPLRLKYGYGGVGDRARAALHVRLNGQDVDSVRLPPAPAPTEQSVIVRLPTGRLRPYTNTLSVDVAFGEEGPAAGGSQFLAIHRDSAIDLRGLPHSVILPRLELFAEAGYPFTQWADLAQTAVVLPDAPTALDYELVLTMAGFFGAQTGWPALAITVTAPADLDAVRDKDLIVLGTSRSQPLLSTWARQTPLVVSPDQFLVDSREMPWRMRIDGPFREHDRQRLRQALTAPSPLDLVVEHIVSPFNPKRSAVLIVPGGADSVAAATALFIPGARTGPFYGGVAIARGGRFESFLLATAMYRSGERTPLEQVRVFLLEHYWLLPLVVVAFAFLVGGWLRDGTERVAARRLAVRA